jgi:hypothetical protein
MPIFKRILIGDGEGIFADDMNATSQYLRAQLLDTLGGLAQADPADVGNSNYCFSVGNGGAPYPIGSLRLKNLPGVIAHYAGPVTGDAPALIVYYLADGELTTTLTPAHASLPRIDVIGIRLHGTEVNGVPLTRHFEDATTGARSTSTMNTAGFPLLEVQLFTGTPGATPAIPSTPGFVPWAGAYVAAGDTIVAPEHVYDYRMPVGGAGFVDVAAKDFSFLPGLTFVDESRIDNSPAVTAGTAGSFNCKFPARPNQRIMQISLVSQSATGADIRKGDEVSKWGLAGLTVIADLSATLTPAGGFFKRTYTPGTGDPPIWGSGMPNWYALAATPTIGILRVSFSGTTFCGVGNARFLVVG